MIITISGPAGSGKSTIAGLLSHMLNFRHYSIGDMRRKKAEELGITLAELNKLGETQDFTDRDVDEFQKKLGEKEDNFVVDGRTSWYFIPHSIKIYLEAELGERARRVFQDERSAENFMTLLDAEKALEEREKSDTTRYDRYYGIDVHDKTHYALVVDTTRMKPQAVVEVIMEYITRGEKPRPVG